MIFLSQSRITTVEYGLTMALLVPRDDHAYDQRPPSLGLRSTEYRRHSKNSLLHLGIAAGEA